MIKDKRELLDKVLPPFSMLTIGTVWEAYTIGYNEGTRDCQNILENSMFELKGSLKVLRDGLMELKEEEQDREQKEKENKEILVRQIKEIAEGKRPPDPHSFSSEWYSLDGGKNWVNPSNGKTVNTEINLAKAAKEIFNNKEDEQ